MSEFDPESITTRLFSHFRNSGFNLSVDEYIAALDAIRGGMGAGSLDELQLILELLWCNSLAEQSQFALIWKTVITDVTEASPKKLPTNISKESKQTSITQPQQQEASSSPIIHLGFAPLPVQTPVVPTNIEDTQELKLYFPVNRRSLVYLWRYLRRPIADGAKDVLDVEATVKQVAQQGFYLAPIYRRREVNHAHLLLFVDREGSMTPFHRFTRDVVETAQQDSTIETVNTYYFHNVPALHVYKDSHMTAPASLERVLTECDHDTSILIVSDAGAARGYRRMERIRATTEFLVHLKQKTSLISWLNPMPKDRWQSTSAEVIAYLVSMEQMNNDGMSNAIDVLRGQSLSRFS